MHIYAYIYEPMYVYVYAFTQGLYYTAPTHINMHTHIYIPFVSYYEHHPLNYYKVSTYTTHHTYTHTHTCTHIHTYIQIHANTHAHTYTHICTYTHIHTHAHIYIDTYTYMHIHIPFVTYYEHYSLNYYTFSAFVAEGLPNNYSKN